MAELATGTSPLGVRLERDGALLRLTLARPKANLIDAGMIAALSSALVAHRGAKGLRGVLLDYEGPHFSFGASVEEHLPAQAAHTDGSIAQAAELLGVTRPTLYDLMAKTGLK